MRAQLLLGRWLSKWEGARGWLKASVPFLRTHSPYCSPSPPWPFLDQETAALTPTSKNICIDLSGQARPGPGWEGLRVHEVGPKARNTRLQLPGTKSGPCLSQEHTCQSRVGLKPSEASGGRRKAGLGIHYPSILLSRTHSRFPAPGPTVGGEPWCGTEPLRSPSLGALFFLVAKKVTQDLPPPVPDPQPRAAYTRGQTLLGFAHGSSTYCVLHLAEAMKEQRSEDSGSTSEALVNNQVTLAE